MYLIPQEGNSYCIQIGHYGHGMTGQENPASWPQQLLWIMYDILSMQLIISAQEE